MGDDVAQWDQIDTEVIQDCRVFPVNLTTARHALDHPCLEPGRVRRHLTTPTPPENRSQDFAPHGGACPTGRQKGSRALPRLRLGRGPTAPYSRATTTLTQGGEENGFAPASMELLGHVNPNPALFRNRRFTFLAEGVHPVAPIRNQGAEETALVHVPKGGARCAGLRQGPRSGRTARNTPARGPGLRPRGAVLHGPGRPLPPGGRPLGSARRGRALGCTAQDA